MLDSLALISCSRASPADAIQHWPAAFTSSLLCSGNNTLHAGVQNAYQQAWPGQLAQRKYLARLTSEATVFQTYKEIASCGLTSTVHWIAARFGRRNPSPDVRSCSSRFSMVNSIRHRLVTATSLHRDVESMTTKDGCLIIHASIRPRKRGYLNPLIPSTLKPRNQETGPLMTDKVGANPNGTGVFLLPDFLQKRVECMSWPIGNCCCTTQALPSP